MDPLRNFSVFMSAYNNNFGTNNEIGQGLGRILSCGARKPEET